MKTKITLFFLLLFVLTQAVHSQTFKAGAALRKITPEKLIPISGGIGTPVMPDNKKGDLFARALVLEKGETRIAIVSIDNIGWPAALGDRSRGLIKSIPAENILIGVTHTHSAPDAYAFPDENGKTGADLKYLDWCVVQVADAVNEALSKLEPASLKTAVGEAKGKTIATLVNYATHPEILGTDRKTLSPDLCGPLYDRIESKVGGIALFMNSAQGGMVTADTRLENGKEANDWDECIRIGNLMADEALRIVEPAPVEANPDIYCASKMVQFPIENDVMRYVLMNSPISKGTKHNDDFSAVLTQVNLLNIGKAQVLTIPGEALPNIGFYVKRHMKTDQPFLFGLTNDAFGYIISKEYFNSFKRYEYISRTSLGEMTGEIYGREALKMIEENPAPVK